VEIKNSTVGRDTQVRHLSYLGDGSVGEKVNIGAGTIFANFDGQKKHSTVVGDGAFVGSGTILVAPVKVGKGAVTGAGRLSSETRTFPMAPSWWASRRDPLSGRAVPSKTTRPA